MRFALLATALCIGAPHAARGDVFEVGANGTMAVRTDANGLIDAADPGVIIGAVSADPPPDVPAAALTTIAPPIVPPAYQASLARAAADARVSPALLAALVWRESRWQPAARSPKGARGLTQLMPGTAHALAVNPGDAAASLAGGARYLRTMLDRFDGNVERALAAYNAGPGRVLRSAGLPAIAETRAYVVSILDRVGASDPSRPAGVTP